MTAFDRLKILCDKQAISVNDLELRLGIGKNSLYSWKKSIPTGANLIKVADHFNVSTDYLLGRTDNQNPIDWAEYDRKLGKDKLKSLSESVSMIEEIAEQYSTTGDRSELIAAHIDDDVSDEQMKEILQFIEFIKTKHDM